MNSEIVNIIQTLGTPKILIIGDLMLDHFTWGSVSRISPEAPTPILNFEEETYQLGGAGFTASVLKQLGAKVDLAAVSGNDSDREIILKMLANQGIGSEGIIADNSRPTTRKQRLQARDTDLSSGMQQMMRVDFESKDPIGQEVENKLIELIATKGSEYDAIIASDYGKGVLTEDILAKISSCKKTTPVFADPKKGADLKLYKGFTAMKPNRFEAESYVGFALTSKDKIIEAGKKILELADLDYTFISLDADGLFYICKNGNQLFVPTSKKEVYDVAGAGDSVISMMALLSTSDVPPRYLMELANTAAGIMISQSQPKTISKEDIIYNIILGDEVSKKLKTSDEVAAILNSTEYRNRKVYFTNGYFDNIKPAQIKFLEKLGSHEGIRIVALNSDNSIKDAGHEPKLPQADRLRLLQMFDCIDYIIVFDAQNCDEMLKKIKPDYFLKGINYADQEIAEAKTLKEINSEVIFIDANA
ncbi:MAG: PfkB family carbohydrate kinase [Lentisphaeraceae bacterium]|nr:PfkB family carbohydrate kinase [Lentisphaeraceae bacterium]